MLNVNGKVVIDVKKLYVLINETKIILSQTFLIMINIIKILSLLFWHIVFTINIGTQLLRYVNK